MTAHELDLPSLAVEALEHRPAEHKLVPVEPTELMEEMGYYALRLTGLAAPATWTEEDHLKLIWEAMIDAAPAIDIPAPAGGEEAVAASIAEAWDVLVNVDDRTSPEEYPDMCLITQAELAGFMRSVAQPAPDHHLRVEVERLRASVDRANRLWFSAKAREREMALEKDDAETRATTAETRIAEMEAALQPWVGYDEMLRKINTPDGVIWGGQIDAVDRRYDACIEATRSALASSNKPVEEGR